MMRRLFAAISVAPDGVLSGLLSECTGYFHGEGIRWVNPRQVHLTLVFLGEIHDVRTVEVCRCFGAVAEKHAPFTFRLHGTGLFGSRYAPRVIWVGTADDTPLRNLGEELLDAAATIGVPRNKLPFVPHLTLGRINSIRNKNHLSQWINSHKETTFAQIPVQEVTLFESILHPSGAEHIVVARFPLGQSQTG